MKYKTFFPVLSLNHFSVLKRWLLFRCFFHNCHIFWLYGEINLLIFCLCLQYTVCIALFFTGYLSFALEQSEVTVIELAFWQEVLMRICGLLAATLLYAGYSHGCTYFSGQQIRLFCFILSLNYQLVVSNMCFKYEDMNNFHKE